jgi:zinc transporter 1/2/3
MGEPDRPKNEVKSETDLESDDAAGNAITDKVLAQIVGVAILEFGVALHRFANLQSYRLYLIFSNSILVGLTLAVNEDFKILFVVLVFHRECPISIMPDLTYLTPI